MVGCFVGLLLLMWSVVGSIIELCVCVCGWLVVLLGYCAGCVVGLYGFAGRACAVG